jgi:hypothetical protein
VAAHYGPLKLSELHTIVQELRPFVLPLPDTPRSHRGYRRFESSVVFAAEP